MIAEDTDDTRRGSIGSASHDERVNILLVDDRADKLLALEVALAPLQENVVSANSGAPNFMRASRTPRMCASRLRFGSIDLL